MTTSTIALACLLATSLTACTVVLGAPEGVDGFDITVTKRGADAGASPDATTPEPPKARETCESLAANTAVDSVYQIGTPGGAGITPQEVFAYERRVRSVSPPGAPPTYVRQLVIGLTETRHECKYRENHLAPISINERRIVVSRAAPVPTVPAIGEGTYSGNATSPMYSGLGMEWESGQRCSPPSPPLPPGVSAPSSFSTTLGGTVLTGVVTITERTPVRIKGSFDVKTSDGQIYTATFDAPVCDEHDTASPMPITCCTP